MKTHYDLNDVDFVNQFKDAVLNPELFSHEAHLRLAWIYIRDYGIDKAITMICGQLLNFVENLGARSKYNETVTIAAIRAVYHFRFNSKSDTFRQFIAEFPQLKNNFKGLLSQHYDIDIFNSEVAKSTFIQPNVLPFD